MGDAVFDVVERHFKDVQLFLPQVGAFVVESRIIDARVVAVHHGKPHFLAVAGGVVRVGIHQVLERVDGCDPREKPDDLFEFADSAAVGVGFVRVEWRKVRGPDEFHAHTGNFGKFRGHVVEGGQGQVGDSKLLEGMSAFMEKGVNIAIGSRGVHKDKGTPAFFKSDLVSAGSFSPTAVRVDQFFLLHGAEPVGGLRGKPVEYLTDFFNQFVAFLKRLERRAGKGIDVGVPRAQAFKF